jgi:hypothetical protein
LNLVACFWLLDAGRWLLILPNSTISTISLDAEFWVMVSLCDDIMGIHPQFEMEYWVLEYWKITPNF